MQKLFATGGGMARPSGSYTAAEVLHDHEAEMVGFVTCLPREAPPRPPHPLCHPDGVAVGHRVELEWIQTWLRPNTRKLTLGEFLAEGEVGKTWRSARCFRIGLAAGESELVVRRLA
jgi:hypothetical protein